MASVVRTLRVAVAAMAGTAVVLAATGWLFLMHDVHLPGPRIGEALPLDELSKRAAVPLLLYVFVWAVVGLLLGLIGRAAGAERITAAPLFAIAVGLWMYVATAGSVFIVRQVPLHEALHSASRLRAVYVAAALAGLGGALAGRARADRRSRAPLVLSFAVAATGILAALEAVLPDRHHTLFAELAPARVHPLASAAVAPLGLALIVVARGLARRKRRAWQLAVAFLLLLTGLHVLHGFDLGATAAMLVTVALVASRHEFKAVPDPENRRVVLRTFLFLVALIAYGCGVLWVNRIMADRPYTLGFALRETGSALAGLTLGGSSHLNSEFGEWFPLSIFVAGLGAAVYLIHGLLAPWRYRIAREAREQQLARDLVTAWGVDTLAPFVLRADKSYFFAEDERSFLAYRVVGGVAIVSGDPIGPPAAFDGLVARFIEFARARDWRIAILGASERCLDLYRSYGLRALYHGDEAVLDVSRFSLDGRTIRKVRQSVHRLERAGYRAEVLHPREIDDHLRAELEGIAETWRGGEPNRGFAMALDALFRLGDEDAVFVVGRDPDDRPAGFLHFALSAAGSALSLSSMPRLRETPNGFNEWLVCVAVEWARPRGIARISLNFAPFAALLAPAGDLSRLQRLERQALLRLKGHFQLDNLLLFNRKFLPDWQRRFVVYERRRDLPRVGIAALAAEAYLPFSGRDRT
jgi:lysyl-tRNA synthetase, class II